MAAVQPPFQLENSRAGCCRVATRNTGLGGGVALQQPAAGSRRHELGVCPLPDAGAAAAAERQHHPAAHPLTHLAVPPAAAERSRKASAQAVWAGLHGKACMAAASWHAGAPRGNVPIGPCVVCPRTSWPQDADAKDRRPAQGLAGRRRAGASEEPLRWACRCSHASCGEGGIWVLSLRSSERARAGGPDRVFPCGQRNPAAAPALRALSPTTRAMQRAIVLPALASRRLFHPCGACMHAAPPAPRRIASQAHAAASLGWAMAGSLDLAPAGSEGTTAAGAALEGQSAAQPLHPPLQRTSGITGQTMKGECAA